MIFTRQRDSRGSTPDFSLVFPTYNPGPRLDHSLAALEQFLADTPASWELVFVCDGCTDGSAERIERWKPRNGSVRLLSYSPNRGKGFAVRQGLIAASAPYRIFTDVDLAYPFADIERVAEGLQAGHDVVIASRTHPESQVQLPTKMLGYALRRHLQSRVFGALVRMLLPLSNGDTQAGLKGFSERAVRTVVPQVTCAGFGFDCEVLTACVRYGLTVTEVPVSVRYDESASTTNFRSTLSMIRDLWRVRRAWPTNLTMPTEPAVRYREAG